ncbi:MAG: response regulator [Planctomycetota bacterium]|jgi:excisionase family DNA binding protein|nr:response regulator [Planctomycetota bacterium]
MPVKPKEVLTTGDVARLCRVTIRTVIKWYEQGRLEGYRLPGSRDRRFTRAAVGRFLAESGLPAELHREGSPLVLVVDDDDGIRALVSKYLGNLGVLEVDEASSGWEAGLKIASRKPRLLLLDYRLGDTTGDRVVDTIRGMSGLEQPSIVIMSAHLTDEQADHILRHGADAWLPKPFDLAKLRDTVYGQLGIAS